MSSLLFLDTRYGQTDENYNNFWTITLPRLNMLKGFTLSLQNVEFPNTVYPINAYNNKFYISEDGGGTVTLTLTTNSYSGTTLATEVAALLNASGSLSGIYTASYNSYTKKLTITLTAGATNFAFVSGANDAYEELGFDSANFAAAASSQVSDHPINVSGSRYVDVVTNFSGNNHSVGTTANVLVRVPLTVDFGSVMFYEPSTDDSLFVTATQFDDVYVQLRDDKGNYWELPAVSHLSLTLKITPIQEQLKRQREDNFDRFRQIPL